MHIKYFVLFLLVALKVNSSICNLQRPQGLVPDLNFVLVCYLGMFKGPGDTACKPCEPGEYQLQQGQESCDLCPENHYCPVSLLGLLWQPGLTNTNVP